MFISSRQQQWLQDHEQSLIRQAYIADKRHYNRIEIEGRACIDFSSNDYLGLATHQAIKKALMAGIERHGLGTGASAAIVCSADQAILEKACAQFLNRDQAIFFNSGYMANLGVISALADRSTTIISDRLSHASLLAGIQMSRAQHCRFQHNNVSQLKQNLEKAKNPLVITEGVFSMTGDIPPLMEAVDLIDHYKSGFLLDDSHGMGVLGHQGGGVCEQFNLSQQKVPCLSFSLGKAFGCMGGVVVGPSSWIDLIRQYAASYRYTTALPAAICGAALKAIDLIKTETWRRESLHQIIQFFVQEAKKRGLPLLNDQKILTPIQSILVGDNMRTCALQRSLLSAGFFVSAIRPPTVPAATARIRVSLNCYHTQANITAFLNAVAASNQCERLSDVNVK